MCGTMYALRGGTGLKLRDTCYVLLCNGPISWLVLFSYMFIEDMINYLSISFNNRLELSDISSNEYIIK